MEQQEPNPTTLQTIEAEKPFQPTLIEVNESIEEERKPEAPETVPEEEEVILPSYLYSEAEQLAQLPTETLIRSQIESLFSIQLKEKDKEHPIKKELKTIVKKFVESKVWPISLFVRPVVIDYPEIKEAYEKAIPFPMCFEQLGANLRRRVNPVYSFVGEIFRDMLMILTNAATFNQPNPTLHKPIIKLGAAIEDAINGFLKAHKCQPLSLHQLISITFRLCPPGQPCPFDRREQHTRPPAMVEIDQLRKNLASLSAVSLTTCLGALSVVMDSSLGERRGQVVLDLDTVDPNVFWWFVQCVESAKAEETRSVKADS